MVGKSTRVRAEMHEEMTVVVACCGEEKRFVRGKDFCTIFFSVEDMIDQRC